MRYITALVWLIACGGDNGATQTPDAQTFDCTDIDHFVTQEHGICHLSADSNSTTAPCPVIHGAYCGDEASCPMGWTLTCDPGGTNCTYTDAAACTAFGESSVQFLFVQTFLGTRGLIVIPDATKPNQCEFRPCI